MKRFRTVASAFLTSPIFALLVYIAAYFVWRYPVDLIVFLLGYVALLLLVLRFSDDARPLFSLLMPLLFMNVIGVGDTAQVPTVVSELPLVVIIVMAVLVILALLIFAWCKRMPSSAFGSWREKTFGFFGIGLLFILGSFALSRVRVEGQVAIAFPYIDALLMGILGIIYLAFRRTQGVKITWAFVWSAMQLGTLMAAQIFTDYALRFDVNHASNFTPMVGWGISNQVAIMLLLLLPFSAYSALNNWKMRGWSLLSLVVQSIAIVLTLSRGGIAAWALLMVGIFVMWWRAEHRHITFWLAGITFALALGAVAFFAPEMLQYVVSHLVADGIGDSGRFLLYGEAWQHFLTHPLFGIGTVFSPTVFQPTPWFHSTFFDTLASLGLVGVFAFGVHLYEKYRFFLTDRDDFKRFALLGIVGSGMYGLIDISYYHFSYFLLLVLLLTVAEQREWLERG